MKNIIKEITYDANFVKGHKLQPAWFKLAKIFILLAVLAGFVRLFGWRRALVFTVGFVFLMLVVHLVYRVKTRKFTRNWLDFVIVEDKGKNIKQGIGPVYYASILVNAVIAFLVSGALAD